MAGDNNKVVPTAPVTDDGKSDPKADAKAFDDNIKRAQELAKTNHDSLNKK